jgi:hypothetical protein
MKKIQIEPTLKCQSNDAYTVHISSHKPTK